MIFRSTGRLKGLNIASLESVALQNVRAACAKKLLAALQSLFSLKKLIPACHGREENSQNMTQMKPMLHC